LQIFNPTLQYGVNPLDDIGPLGRYFNEIPQAGPLLSIYEILSPGK